MLVKVGLSAVSVEGARKNLAAEIPQFDFDKTRAAAEKAWQDVLGTIEARATDRKTLETFYSALYHACLAPNVFSDVNRSFYGPDAKTHTSPGFTYCTTFSLWDVFRGENPLLYVIQPRHMENAVPDDVETLRVMSPHCLPVWVNAGKENWCMIAYHSISTIADAYRKGLRGFDADFALTAMLDTMNGDRGRDRDKELAEYRAWLRRPQQSRRGQRSRPPAEAVRLANAGAVLQRCLHRAVRRCHRQARPCGGKPQASRNYRNVYDSEVGFMRGKLVNGKWAEPFDPLEVNFDDFTEADAWHYLFFAPHDTRGLIELLGGEQQFVDRLDAMFDSPTGNLSAIPDLTGLIGQYCHGNEPCHHMAYLYACARTALEDAAAGAASDDRATITTPVTGCRATTIAGKSPHGTYGARGPLSGRSGLGGVRHRQPGIGQGNDPPRSEIRYRQNFRGDCPAQLAHEHLRSVGDSQRRAAGAEFHNARGARGRRRLGAGNGPAAEVRADAGREGRPVGRCQ